MSERDKRNDENGSIDWNTKNRDKDSACTRSAVRSNRNQSQCLRRLWQRYSYVEAGKGWGKNMQDFVMGHEFCGVVTNCEKSGLC